MTQANPNPADPNVPADASPAGQPPGTLPTPPAKKKKRRLWLKIPLALLVILILLVVFLPQIAGFAFVRNLVVSRVNDNLNGKLQIADWHIGWTGGVVVQGVKVFDDKGTVILEYMEEAPFASRLPVFVGDDKTDEYGFVAVTIAGGWAVKVGRGTTSAQYRLPNVAAVRKWLSALGAGAAGRKRTNNAA